MGGNLQFYRLSKRLGERGCFGEKIPVQSVTQQHVFVLLHSPPFIEGSCLQKQDALQSQVFNAFQIWEILGSWWIFVRLLMDSTKVLKRAKKRSNLRLHDQESQVI